MWIGIWPPSRFNLRLLPERAPAPLWPRPEVFPTPEPSPRPTRFLRWRDPGAGLSEWSPISCATSLLLDLDEVADRLDRAAHGRVVGPLRGPSDLAEAEGPQGVALARVGAIRRAVLGDAKGGCHHAMSAGSEG